MALTFDVHNQVRYRDSIKNLAGELTKSMLEQYVEKDNQQGEVIFLDSFVADDEATSGLVTGLDANYRKGYEQGTANHANFMLTQTPHMEIARTRTQLVPILNEAGHTFRSIDKALANQTEDSKVLISLTGRMAKRKERILLDALFAFQASRGKNEGVAAPVDFPGTQEITVASGELDKDVCNDIKTKFEDNYIGAVGEDEELMMLISPQQKNFLIANSGGVLHSKDFISSNGHFEGGTLPDVYGVHMIVHPELKVGRGYEVDGDGNGTWSGGRAVAFTKKWGCLNQFEGLSSVIAPDIGERNQLKLYMSEMINAAREDDKRVVHIQFGSQA